MRTTVTIDEDLIARAAELTGRSETSALMRLGLQALIQQESAKRLALLGGTDPHAVGAPRRESA
jgi:Arc/MetJ family transcription regulator